MVSATGTVFARPCSVARKRIRWTDGACHEGTLSASLSSVARKRVGWTDGAATGTFSASPSSVPRKRTSLMQGLPQVFYLQDGGLW
jgi:hypothetical protein